MAAASPATPPLVDLQMLTAWINEEGAQPRRELAPSGAAATVPWMSPLIDVLETVPVGEERKMPGRYDRRRGLRVDEVDRPIVEFAQVDAGTETRGGRD